MLFTLIYLACSFFQIVHPKYNFFTYENDIALVKTETRVRFADNISPICLPGNDDLLVGKYWQTTPVPSAFRAMMICL
jgi:hypothetical protein